MDKPLNLEFRECKTIGKPLLSRSNQRKRTMADNKSFKKGVPEGMSVEQVLGLDVRRYWASGVQVTSAEGFTFLVFREQMAALTGGAEQIIQKNVVSLVVPTEVARQLRDILDSQFPTGSGGQNGQ